MQHVQSCTARSHFITRRRVAQELQGSGLHISSLKNNCYPHVMSHSLPHLTLTTITSSHSPIHLSYLSDSLTNTRKIYGSRPIFTLRCSTAEWRINTNPISHTVTAPVPMDVSQMSSNVSKTETAEQENDSYQYEQDQEHDGDELFAVKGKGKSS